MECLRALFLSNPQDDLAEIRSAKGDRVPSTCEWILTQHQYTTWLIEDGPQLLWLSGGPGIGKTMISSLLVEELTHLAERSSQMTLAYYFCDDKNERRRTATAILRGLILQLLRQRPVLFKYIQTDFDIEHHSLFTDFHALWRNFVRMTQDPGAGNVYCLIDALDECERESRQLFLKKFTRLFGPQQSKTTSVKFVLTSRRENDIEEEFLFINNPFIQNLQIDKAKVNRDLSKFIDVKVDELSRRKRYTSVQKEKIRSTLTKKADGTFLYISLVLHDLRMTKIFWKVAQKLETLPSGLYEVYDRILRLIDAECEEIAKKVLIWVAVARRPLTVDELAMAVALGMGGWKNRAIPPEDCLDELKDCFRCCEPLVQVDDNTHTINLVHQSAKEYLLCTYLQENDGLSQYHMVSDTANLLLFRTCWTYLSLEELEQGGGVIIRRDATRKLLQEKVLSDQDLNDHCFLQYAFREWQGHALAASPALTTDLEFWNYGLKRSPTLRDFWLLKAVAQEQELMVQQLLESGADPNCCDSNSLTPLMIAAVKGLEAIVRMLLSRADVAANSRDDGGRTALSIATMEGHEAIVKLLLSRNDVIADLQDIRGRTPLSFAAIFGCDNIATLLLSRDDVTADHRDLEGRTPLSLAAGLESDKRSKLLSSRILKMAHSQPLNNHGALVSRYQKHWQYSRFGLTNGHEAVVRMLLSREDVIVDSRDNKGLEPWVWATTCGNDTLRTLIKRKMKEVSSGPRDQRVE